MVLYFIFVLFILCTAKCFVLISLRRSAQCMNTYRLKQYIECVWIFCCYCFVFKLKKKYTLVFISTMSFAFLSSHTIFWVVVICRHHDVFFFSLGIYILFHTHNHFTLCLLLLWIFFFFSRFVVFYSVFCNKKQLEKGAKAKTNISMVWALNTVLFLKWFIARCCCCGFFAVFCSSFSSFHSIFFIFFLFKAIVFFVLITSVRLMVWSRGYGMCWR